MVENLKSNDPYRNMETGEKGIRPDFLRESDKKKEAAAALRGAEDEAGVDTGRVLDGGLEDAARAERGGFYRGGGKAAAAMAAAKTAKGAKGAKIKKAAIAFAGIGILVALVGIIFIAPSIIIGTIDYNLQKALGFTDTVAILEEQSEYVTAEMMAKGEMPSGYSSDLARNGIEMGQLTAAGEFVRTDRYVANIDELDVAAEGIYYANAGEGKLVALYDNEVIRADEFVAAVESNPAMYAAYSEALDISARYYYSKEVDNVYKEMGLSRGSFNNWESTGDNQKDEENFYAILTKMLDDNSNVELGGYNHQKEVVTYEVKCSESESGDEDGKCYDYDVIETNYSGINPSSGVASSIIDDVASKTRDSSTSLATDKAAQLLNTAVSASEPYLAASAFMAVEEPIQRARIDGDGPVNEVMNALTKSTEITYVDVNTGETKTISKSILETQNFVAAVSDSSYSKDEANNFSRDRVVQVTNRANDDATKNTIIATDGKKKSKILSILNGLLDADESALMSAEDSIKIAMDNKNSDVFSSVIGGNRAIEGGSFISNGINQRMIGAMPSSGKTIAAYHKEVEEVLARQAEADRATLSPFDVSSPNTFLGSLVRKMGSMLIKNSVTSRITAVPVIKSVASLTKDAVASLFGSNAVADGADDFTTMAGDGCSTMKSAVGDLEGDLYCTSHNTVHTGYMDYTENDWKNAGVIDANGGLSSGMKDFTNFGMERIATVGVKSAEICQKKRSGSGSFINNILGMFDVCGPIIQYGDDGKVAFYEDISDIATGAAYTLSSQNPKGVSNVQLYSGYALYDTVSSLLSEKQSKVAAYKEQYYAENPKDNSAAGRLARISGMTKAEAEIALNYAEQLDYIAKYDAGARYKFGEILDFGDEGLMFDDFEVMVATYALLLDKMTFSDVRNRTFVV